MALARILASLHDSDGRVAVKGFYDGVRDWGDEVREQIRSLPFVESAFREETGADSLGGERGFSVLERVWTRPTCEVNGLLSGYTGEGAKTVLPAKAMAKVSCRLVPDQDPGQIEELFRAHVQAFTPEGVTVDVAFLHGGKPWRAKLEGRLVEAAAAALESAFGRPVVYAGEGGSIPIVPEFERVLDAPALLMGLGLPGENAHAPDEWMSVENFEKGTIAAAELLSRLAER
jgi:acetylornithine deacetylase/succinyl-diaminopimelate desuccinylase-like protein